MSLNEFQNLLLELYISPSFRKSLETDFKQTLKGYQLTDTEVSMFTQLANKKELIKSKIENFNTYIFRRKYDGLWDELKTVNMFFSFLKNEVMTALKKNETFNNRTTLEFFDDFMSFIDNFYAHSDSHIIKCFKEAVKYDLITCKAPLLVKQSLEEIDVQSVSNSMSLAKETTDSLVLTKSPSVFLETFNYNIPALYEGLDLKKIKIQPSIFAFILLDIQTVQICRLSPAIQFIVKKAEQPISIDELVKASASFHNLDSIPEKFKQICVGLIQKLCEKGILIELSKNIFHE